MFEWMASLELAWIYAVGALGLWLTLRVIRFSDLTCDGSFVTGSVLMAVALQQGCSLPLCFLLSLLGGALCGFVTGFLSLYGKIPELLSGILVAFMLYSLNLRFMGGVPNLSLLYEKTIFGFGVLPVLGFCLLWVFGICGYFLSTQMGLAAVTVGSNPRLALLMGIPIKYLKLAMLMLSNALIALSGALFCQHQRFTDISQGMGTLIVLLASIMVGEVLFPFRSFWGRLLAVILGSMVYRTVLMLALKLHVFGLMASDFNLITGLMVVAFLAWAPKKQQGVL